MDHLAARAAQGVYCHGGSRLVYFLRFYPGQSLEGRMPVTFTFKADEQVLYPDVTRRNGFPRHRFRHGP